jgi:hypothetical protein
MYGKSPYAPFDLEQKTLQPLDNPFGTPDRRRVAERESVNSH